MTNRIHIDAPTGVIEVEGEKDFVEAQLDKLMPLIQACGFGTAPRPKSSDVAAGGAQVMPDTESTEDGNGSENNPTNGRKRTRKAGKATPKGHSCADRMLVLRGEGFFKSQKVPAEIVEGLGKKGWTHNTSQVSAAGGNMFTRGDILRTKVGNGFAYYWDRD